MKTIAALLFALCVGCPFLHLEPSRARTLKIAAVALAAAPLVDVALFLVVPYLWRRRRKGAR